jgi:hypothetical protein
MKVSFPLIDLTSFFNVWTIITLHLKESDRILGVSEI